MLGESVSVLKGYEFTADHHPDQVEANFKIGTKAVLQVKSLLLLH